MSEYQYYEFQAIDRPLDAAARAKLRELSSRARITATRFVNFYNWGDFRGDPARLMADWFDLHLYLANWGTRRLMIRVPEWLIDRVHLDALRAALDGDFVSTAGSNLILDIVREEIESEYLKHDEEADLLVMLAPLRADLLEGKPGLLYMIWLMAVEDEIVPEDAVEPLPGPGPLTGALLAFAEFFRMDPDLVAAAAERPAAPPASSPEANRRAILALPEEEKAEYLARLIEGDPHVVSELRFRLRDRAPAQDLPLRTVSALRTRAAAVREARERAASGNDAPPKRNARAGPGSKLWPSGARRCGTRSKPRSPAATARAMTGRASSSAISTLSHGSKARTGYLPAASRRCARSMSRRRS